MRYTVKSPKGAAYDLTREEMSDPKTVQSLGLAGDWVVRVGEEWVPMLEFLGGPPPRFATSMDAKATWTPATAFCLGLRFLGVLLLFWFVAGVWSGIELLVVGHEIFRGIPGSFVFILLVKYTFLLVFGGYLVRGARGLVTWAFPDYRDERKN